MFWYQGEKLRIVKTFFVSAKGGVGTEPDVPQSSEAHLLLQTLAAIKTANKKQKQQLHNSRALLKD